MTACTICLLQCENMTHLGLGAAPLISFSNQCPLASAILFTNPNPCTHKQEVEPLYRLLCFLQIPMVQYFMHNKNHFQMYLNVYIFTGYEDNTAYVLKKSQLPVMSQWQWEAQMVTFPFERHSKVFNTFK